MTALAVEAVPAAAPPPARLEHQPALDGLRGLAVLAVVAYHLSVARDPGIMRGRVSGGFLGVDLFFVLSGFLITSLLLIQHAKTGQTATVDFWARRARRLLPAVIVLMGLMAVYALVSADPWQLQSIRRESLATLLYVQNWYLIYGHPAGANLGHTWTLSIEEQWYLIWPLLLAGLLLVVRGSRRWSIVAVLLLAGGSAVWMALLVDRGGFRRAYEGTDARACELLIGAALAMYLLRRTPSTRRSVQIATEALGVAAMLGFLWMLIAVNEHDTWLYRGGFVLTAILGAVIILACVQPTSVVLGRVMSWRPLCLVGLISYGLYLYHVPIIGWLVPGVVDVTGNALLALRVVVFFGLAVASYLLIEMPVRRKSRTWRSTLLLAPAAMVAAVVLVAATMGGRSLGVYDRVALYAKSVASRGAGDVRVLVAGDRPVLEVSRGGGVFKGQRIQGLPMPLIGCDGFPGRPVVFGRPVGQLRCRSRQLFRSAVSGYEPDVSVLMVGSLAQNGRLIGPDFFVPGSPGHERNLQQGLDAMADAVTSNGARLILVLPSCSKGGSTAGVAAPSINRAWRQVAASRAAGVVTVDPTRALCPDEATARALRNQYGSLNSAGVTAFWRWIAPIAAAMASKS